MVQPQITRTIPGTRRRVSGPRDEVLRILRDGVRPGRGNTRRARARRPVGAEWPIASSILEGDRRARKIRGRFVESALYAALLCFAIGFAHIFAGCASSPAGKLEQAVDYGQKTLAAVDVGATKVANVHRDGAEAAVSYCRDTLPEGAGEDERRACLARAGFAPAQVEAFEAALLEASAIYDELAALLERLENLVPVLESGLESAEALR